MSYHETYEFLAIDRCLAPAEMRAISLSASVLAAIDKLAGPDGSRSAVIERILRQFMKRREREVTEARDLATLNRHSQRLNAEAADVAGYQAWPGE